MGTLYKKKEREKKKANYEAKRPIIYECCDFKATQPEYLLESVQALNFKLKYNNFKRLIKNGSTFTLPVHGFRWQKN